MNIILNWIDGFLNKITMYRIVLYVLIGLLSVAGILSFWGMMSFTWVDLAVTT